MTRPGPHSQCGLALGSWLDQDNDVHETHAQLVGDTVWFEKQTIGVATMKKDSDFVRVYPDPGASRESVRFTVLHQWQPFLHQAFDIQVMHASAAFHRPTKTLVTLSGPTRSGKSTTAYGLAQRPDWIQIADDFIGFEIRSGEIEMVRFPNLLRLRPESARHFSTRSYEDRLLEAELDIKIARACFILLRPTGGDGPITQARRLNAAESTVGLLSQAYAIRTHDSSSNRRLMRAYLGYIERIPVFELCYEPDFATFERTIDLVEQTAIAFS